jgi:hypothetical protein
VAEAPRTGLDYQGPYELAGAEKLFAAKYGFGEAMYHDGRHGWLRLAPETLTSWDFRRLNGDFAR